jgi:hypothetical protein
LDGLLALSQGRYLHRTTQTQKKRRQTSICGVGFEPTIPVFERAKIVHALDRAATVIGPVDSNSVSIVTDLVFPTQRLPRYTVHQI